MKLQVLKSFKDKETKELYGAGAEIELADVARINDVVARGLCRIVEIDTMASEEKPAPKKTK